MGTVTGLVVARRCDPLAGKCSVCGNSFEAGRCGRHPLLPLSFVGALYTVVHGADAAGRNFNLLRKDIGGVQGSRATHADQEFYWEPSDHALRRTLDWSWLG